MPFLNALMYPQKQAVGPVYPRVLENGRSSPAIEYHDLKIDEEQIPMWTDILGPRAYSHEPVPVNPEFEPPLDNRSQYSTTTTTVSPPSPPKNTQDPPQRITKPRVATTYWDEEHTTCFQVRVDNIVVLRRENDNYVNGTKLLNVTGMTRGKRDGMLKIEKGRLVMRNGSMNLKGVWIPFERAAEIARNEGVDQMLYPLFVDDIREAFRLEQGRWLVLDTGKESSLDDHLEGLETLESQKALAPEKASLTKKETVY